MRVADQIKQATAAAIRQLYQTDWQAADILVNETKPEFEGDYTVVLFAMVKQLKKSPDALGQELGSYLVAENPTLFTGFTLIKGFLNLTIADGFWLHFLAEAYPNAAYGQTAPRGEKVMVEYSSPNTNKPLHLGHLRNNFLGWSIA
ncbi:MAG: arginine--tRNA ligase, partial [Chitinophagaceae bacterium]|nr:arginine--tRNA ligase [Chitinophagaceae bacterium]